MRRLYTFVLMLLLMAACTLHVPVSYAQTANRIQGWCEQGNITVPSSSTRVQGSYPSCTVTVYDVGTLNLATIYANSALTPKANPFTASSNSSWFFYALAGGRFDVKFSGGGITVPFTLGDFVAPVTSAGNISGTLATGFIPKASGANTLVDSAVSEGTVGGNATLKVNESLIVGGTTTDLAGTGLISLGAITEQNSTTNAQIMQMYAVGGGSGKGIIASGFTGSGSYKPLALQTGGNDALTLTTEPFAQLTQSYTGATKSAAGTVALRNNAGALEKSENGGAWGSITASSGISGLTTGVLVKASGSTSVVNSNVSEDLSGTPILKVNEKLMVGGTTSDIVLGGLISLGAIVEANSPTNAQTIFIAAVGGGSGKAIIASEFTGSGSYKPMALQTGGNDSLTITVDPIIQLTQSYTGGTLSAAGTVALRNNNGVLEVSQNGAAWVAFSVGGISASAALTANGSVYATGTAAVTSTAAMANGQLLMGRTGNVPLLGNITNLGGITVTNGAGTIAVGVAPATANALLYGTGANGFGFSSNLLFDGSTLVTGRAQINGGGTATFASFSNADGLYHNVSLTGASVNFSISELGGTGTPRTAMFVNRSNGAGDTPISIEVDGNPGTVAVTLGAADSCTAGFRCLRVPN